MHTIRSIRFWLELRTAELTESVPSRLTLGLAHERLSAVQSPIRLFAKNPIGDSISTSAQGLGCLGSRPDPSEHEFVDLVSAHAYKRDSIDLLVGQAAASKCTALVRCESLDLVGRLGLLWVD